MLTASWVDGLRAICALVQDVHNPSRQRSYQTLIMTKVTGENRQNQVCLQEERRKGGRHWGEQMDAVCQGRMDNHLPGLQGEHQHPREKGRCVEHDWGAMATEGGDWRVWICPEDGGITAGWRVLGWRCLCRPTSAHLLSGVISGIFNKCLRTTGRSVFHILAA